MKKKNDSRLWGLLILCLGVMAVSQIFLIYNQMKIDWYEQKVTNVAAESGMSLIIVTDVETNQAGALNYEGTVVIPIENDLLDPWTGDVISNGMYHEGDLYWTVSNSKVGIVNEKNEVVIPNKYGYLERSQENQFIAGIGTISKALEHSGSYVNKKYGVITDTGTVVPLEYDELEYQSEKEVYVGKKVTDRQVIDRKFNREGKMVYEAVTELVPEAPAAPAEQEDTEPETASIEDNVQKSETENSEDIQTYKEQSGSEVTLKEDYIYGKERKIHYNDGICTLELLDSEDTLVEFSGKRVFGADTPEFSEDEKLILDQWNGELAIYSAKSGDILARVETEADYFYQNNLLAYDDGRQYTVKALNGNILFSAEHNEQDRFMNSPDEKSRFIMEDEYFVYAGDDGKTLVSNQGIIITSGVDMIVYNDENKAQKSAKDKVFICKKNDQYGAFRMAGDRILNYQYRNIEFFKGHVKGLKVTNKEGKTGIVDYSGNAVIPLEYDNVGYGRAIHGISESMVEKYIVLNEKKSNHYFGQKGDEIYYLNNDGGEIEQVKYVVRQEKSGGGLSDILACRSQSENRVTYRIAGNRRFMSNAFGTGFLYRRCHIQEIIGNTGISFVLIDGKDNRIGIFKSSYEDVDGMGYQQLVYEIWLISSRVFFILAIWILFQTWYGKKSDLYLADYIWEIRQKWKRKD